MDAKLKLHFSKASRTDHSHICQFCSEGVIKIDYGVKERNVIKSAVMPESPFSFSNVAHTEVLWMAVED